ncbi:hypothetical protein A5844_000939 [Enterococcus sp. 10A9_DIV0425]|uniref:Uncharacterized protein n=1 Tax=Candidatus Enterococcus wittei TaxID=1987383 RepID=A0A242JZP9_9ENTE|nr:hypothetical protein A5844_000939 [Enterococcus sp. 10A9_DIV0425]
MNNEIWNHFKKDFSVYIGIGVTISLLSATNIFYFQKLLDGFGKELDIRNILIYGFTIVIVLLFQYLHMWSKSQEQSFKMGYSFILRKWHLLR